MLERFDGKGKGFHSIYDDPSFNVRVPVANTNVFKKSTRSQSCSESMIGNEGGNQQRQIPRMAHSKF